MNTDTLLGAMVGATFTLALLECGFWALIAYSLHRAGKQKRMDKSTVSLRTSSNRSDGDEQE